MHQKLTKHGRFCKQNNQLPTKSHDELEDNSIVGDYVYFILQQLLKFHHAKRSNRENEDDLDQCLQHERVEIENAFRILLIPYTISRALNCDV
jgi:hypothetical protein